jgi:tetratricopeptide (TPR) repeat protein
MINTSLLNTAISALIIFTSLRPGPSLAGTQAEYQAIQQWCIGREKWSAEGSKTDYPHPQEYFHFHHYCYAINYVNKLYSTVDPGKRRYLAQLVVGDTGYVISHVPEDHFLMPEVYALRGRGLLLAKQMPQAESSLLKALALDSRHLGAHLSLGALYLESKRKEKAIETVKAGLTIDPQHKGLRRLAGELGIKLEELKPSPAPQQPATAPATPQSAGAHTPPTATPAQKPALGEVDKPPTKTDVSPKTTETAPPNVGSPTNPWCRFCPETPTSDRPPSSPSAAPKAAP